MMKYSAQVKAAGSALQFDSGLSGAYSCSEFAIIGFF